MRSSTTRSRRAIVLFPIVSCIAVAKAETLNFGIDAGVGETDNVTLTHDDRVSQTIGVTDVDFDYVEKSRRLDVDALGKFTYLDYLQDAYPTELVGRFDGSANLALVPQLLTWVFQEDFGQAAIDPFTPITPSNLENINYVATGPDLHVRLGGLTFVDVSARVAETHYETSPFSNTRGMVSLAYGLKLSPFSNTSINVATERVLFDNTVLNPDFDLTSVFARYELAGARTQLSADVGVSAIRESAGTTSVQTTSTELPGTGTGVGGSTSGALAKFSVLRKLTPMAQISLALVHDTTDGSASFSGIQPGASGSVGAAPAINTSQNYTRNYGSIDWEYQRNRTSLGLSGRVERDAYPGEPALNHTMTTGELRLQRQLTQAFAFQITGRLYKTEYSNVNVPGLSGSPDTQTTSVGATLTWRHGRALEVKFSFDHDSYTTPTDNLDYGVNRVFVKVGYRPSKASPTVASGLGP